MEVFDLAGLKICLTEAPPIIVDAVYKAFSLSMKQSDTYDVDMTGAFAKDEGYLDGMPAFIRLKYDEMLPGSTPLIFNGPENEIAVLDRGQENSSYTLCAVPYNRFEYIAQKMTYKSVPLIFQSVLIPLIAELLLKQEKLLMHAACVVSPSGQGLLFLGDSGDGKTTTAYTMVMQGYRLLSDDMVIACKTRQGIQFVAVREKLNLTAKTIAFFPELSRQLTGKLPEGMHKLPVDPKAVLPEGRLVDSVRPSFLFILRKQKGGPKLLAAGGKQIVDAVLKSCTFARSEVISQQRVALIWDILDQAKPFELITGLNPSALGTHLAETMRNKVPSANECAPCPAVPMAPTRARHAAPADTPARLHLLKTIMAETLDGSRPAENGREQLLSIACGESFVRWAGYHRIDPVLMRWIVDQGDHPQNRLFHQAKEKMLEDSARSLYLFSWTQIIAEQLMAVDVSPIMLRGPALAARYFPAPQLRHYRDLDFIIQPHELKISEEVLVKLGFRLQGDRAYWMKKKELRYSNGRVDIELHWELYREIASRNGYPIPDHLHDSSTIGINGASVKALSTTHLMFSSCLHFALEHNSDRLVRLVDLRQLSRDKKDLPNWLFIVRQAKDSGTRMAVGHTLLLAKILVDARIPQDVLIALAAEKLWDKIAGRLLTPEDFLSGGLFSKWRRSLYRKMLS